MLITELEPLSRREFWMMRKEIGKDHFIFLITNCLKAVEKLVSLIGILGQGKMKAVNSLDGLWKVLDYPYSFRLMQTSK